MNSFQVINLPLQIKCIALSIFLGLFATLDVYGQPILEVASSTYTSENMSENSTDGMLLSLATNSEEDEEAISYSCDSCNGVGGYSQIITSGSAVRFEAHTFVFNSGGGSSPCYSGADGTVTFDFTVTDADTGQLVAQGSIPQNFSGMDYSSQCSAYEYMTSGPYSNLQIINLPSAPSSIHVELTTTHKVGNNTYEHTTWTL